MRGDELTPWLIRYGYSQGAFPMTVEDDEVDWFQPITRALFPIEGIHVSKSMRKILNRIEQGAQAPPLPCGLSGERGQGGEGRFGITFDTAFEDVMRGCMRPDGNWISEDFIRAYTQIHHEGWGHCVEVWRGDRLVGGLYGIALGTCFCAESMFHRATNASKVALWAMVEKCRSLGFTIFDAQVMNPHLQSLGAYPMPHGQYMRILADALQGSTPWSAPPRL